MNSIDFETLLVTIFVLVDDWYNSKRVAIKGNNSGVKPKMSDSEIMTLALVMDYLPFPGETKFIGYIRANYQECFPNLLDHASIQSTFKKLRIGARNIKKRMDEKNGRYQCK